MKGGHMTRKPINERMAEAFWVKERLEEVEVLRLTLPEYKRQEQFYFIGQLFDVVRARWITADGRLPQRIIVADWAKAYGLDRSQAPVEQDGKLVLSFGFFGDIKHDWAMEHADLEEPLLVGRWRIMNNPKVKSVKQLLLMDGYNRLYAAAQKGVADLPALFLSEAEVELVRL
jgi:hypothetical protein